MGYLDFADDILDAVGLFGQLFDEGEGHLIFEVSFPKLLVIVDLLFVLGEYQFLNNS